MNPITLINYSNQFYLSIADNYLFRIQFLSWFYRICKTDFVNNINVVLLLLSRLRFAYMQKQFVFLNFIWLDIHLANSFSLPWIVHAEKGVLHFLQFTFLFSFFLKKTSFAITRHHLVCSYQLQVCVYVCVCVISSFFVWFFFFKCTLFLVFTVENTHAYNLGGQQTAVAYLIKRAKSWRVERRRPITRF